MVRLLSLGISITPTVQTATTHVTRAVTTCEIVTNGVLILAAITDKSRVSCGEQSGVP